MKYLLYLSAVLFFPFYCRAEVIRLSLVDAINSKSVSVDAVNFKGRFTGNVMKLAITNNLGSTIQVKMNPGAIFVPDDAALQPMVLAGAEAIVIAPNTERTVVVAAFCGNAAGGCPQVNAHYRFSGVGSDTLVKVLKFIKDNSVIDDLGQAAVWAITNQNPLSDVYDSSRAGLSADIRTLICNLTGRPQPAWFALRRHTQAPGIQAFDPKILQIAAQLHQTLAGPATLTAGLYNNKGEMVQAAFAERHYEKGNHLIDVHFDTQNMPVGDYSIRLTDAGKVVQELAVLVN